MYKEVKENCINCNNFAWWDGDYCCLSKRLILQPSPDGEFSSEILKTIQTSDECIDYDKSENSVYENSFINFINNLA